MFENIRTTIPDEFFFYHQEIQIEHVYYFYNENVLFSGKIYKEKYRIIFF